MSLKGAFPWFGAGMALLFFISLGLRFWGLGRFNALVFDEVYYANFARGFLQGKQEFGGHPPLSSYFIAFGIWVGERMGWGADNTRNTLTGMFLSTVSYRWMNALIGAFFPLVVGAIALQLTHRRLYAIIATFLAALDGLFLVESRYALNNIYLVLLGLLGQLFLLLALNHLRQRALARESGLPRPQSLFLWLWLVLAGVGFGGAIAIKWNGAAFLLGAIALWVLAWAVALLNRILSPARQINLGSASPLAYLSRLHLGHGAIAFGLIPALTYWMSWWPYLNLGPNYSFWSWQKEILSYHSRVGGFDAHQYCSHWYTWPLMQRPVAYFYQTVTVGQTPPPELNVVPPPQLAEAIYDVHAMGNPILWWFATLGIVLSIGALVYFLWQQVRVSAREPGETLVMNPWQLDAWPLLFLVVNWGANLLPWVKVTRCTFIYHYMGALVFTLLAIALWIERAFYSPSVWHRRFAIATLILIGMGFLFWLPLFLGLPLSPAEIQMRRWFMSWI
ncbi:MULTISPECIES: phospholipid carrier-dependent glycosyltransferase [unclassified Leptolyngbya]|uniref:phospholipid carrier-dependent glycosyltransferase n=1 Tax=unclassified Leptolyngbya TaxID=2650499 RepID=UPI0018EF55D5|nr:MULTISPECIES: phospholipid carrier-dependent glycosyltransferase [unclassified Leptolyngbya]